MKLVNRRRLNISEGSSNLPYDAEIEYIESAGYYDIDAGPYIDTLVNSELGYIECQLLLYNQPDTGYWRAFGSYNSDNLSDQIILFYTKDPYVGFKLNNVSATNKGHGVITISKTQCSIPNGGNNFLIFTFKQNDIIRAFAKMRVYYFKMWNTSNELIRDFIPVRIGQVGYLYDKVSGQLFGNVNDSSDGEFILGNDKYDYDNTVDWLFTDGNQWIELPFIASEITDAIQFDAARVTAETQQRYCMPAGAEAIFQVYINGSNKLGSSRNGSWVESSSATVSTARRIIKVDHKAGKVYMDSASITYNARTSTKVSSSNLRLFYSAGNYPFKGYIYGVKIWRNDVLVFDLIPVVSNGVGCLYDKISKRTYSSKNFGTFITPLDCTALTTASYIQDGLVAMWDGIENGGVGVHVTDETLLKEIVNNVQATIDATFTWSSNQNKLSAVIVDKGISSTAKDKFACITFPFTTNLGNSYTLEMVYSVTTLRSTNVSNLVNCVPHSNMIEIYQYNNTYRAKGSTASEWNTSKEVAWGFNYNAYIQRSTPRGDFYLNGLNVSRSGTSFEITLSPPNAIGFSNCGHYGTIYAFRIYNRPLSFEELRTNYDIDLIRFNLT